jgi:hypothetical protein
MSIPTPERGLSIKLYIPPILNSEMEKQNKRYPKGHFLSICISLGVPLGIPLWLATDNPGMIGAGVAIGVAIGAGLEKKYNKNPRPLTEEEKKERKKAALFGGLVLALGVIVFLFIFLSR